MTTWLVFTLDALACEKRSSTRLALEAHAAFIVIFHCYLRMCNARNGKTSL